MKLIHLIVIVASLAANKSYAMGEVVDLLQNSTALSEFTVIRSDNKVTFKSNTLQKNIYGSDSHIRIWVSTVKLDDGEDIETADIYFGIVPVKYGDTTTGVKAPPQLRIYYPDRYVVVKIRCEDTYDINGLLGVIQDGLTGYKALSVNGCGGTLQWFYP